MLLPELARWLSDDGMTKAVVTGGVPGRLVHASRSSAAVEVVVTALVLAASERPASALIADPNDPPAGRRLRACGEEQLACGADILPCLCVRAVFHMMPLA